MNLSYTRVSFIFVLDQDEALDFYVGKPGLEVAIDAKPRALSWGHAHRSQRRPR